MRTLHLAVFLCALGLAVDARGLCLEPPGDIDGNGSANVADAVCSLLVNLWSIGPGALPGCVGGQPTRADLNCANGYEVGDTILAVTLALGNALPAAQDSDGDGCLNACEVSAVCGDGQCEAPETCGTCAVDCCVQTTLVYWLRADSISGAVNGAPLEVWPDLSGNARNGTQSNAARRPVWVAPTGAAPAAVRFDGADDQMLLPNNPFAAAAGDWTVVAVVRSSGARGHIVGTGSSDAGFLTSFGAGLQSIGGAFQAKSNQSGVGSYVAAGAPIGDGRLHLAVATETNAGLTLHVDGLFVGQSTAASNPFGYSRVTIGASDGSAGGDARDPWSGEIVELRVYQTALNTGERASLESYFADEYGVELGNPYDCPTAVLPDGCGVCGGNGASCGATTVASMGPALWLRAHDLRGHANESLVGGWSQAGGSGPGADVVDVTRRPTYRAAWTGGLPAVVFDGVDDRLDFATNVFDSPTSPITIFALLTTFDTQGHIIGTGSSSAGFLTTFGEGVILNNGAPTFKAVSSGSGTLQTSPNVINNGAPRLLMFQGSDRFSVQRRDGAFDSAQTNQLLNPHNYTRATIGASDGSAANSSQDAFGGAVSEVLVFAREVTDGEREAVEAYFQAKYGLSIATPTGCDGVQGSGLAWDACGICGGDDSACADVSSNGLELWLRAQDISFHGATTRPLGRWASALGPSAVGAAQSATSRMPVAFAAGLGQDARIVFDGTTDRLDLSANLFAAASTPKTVFAVLRSSDSAAHIIGTGSSSSGFLTTFGHGLTLTAGVRPTAKANSSGSGVHLVSTQIIDDTQLHVVSARIANGDSEIRVNAAPPNSSGAGVNPFGYSRSTIGASDGGASNSAADPLAGTIAEFLVYNRILSPAESTAIRNYLDAKY
jgi:hypothetical protein